ncbi:MAG TPA: hypothetical protein QGH92_01660 [Candidatus Parcubacteria bacterium]|jgi:hypothetical protein|nr:hypothetical protein [Candidatus Parcubacteria bacterium]
MKFTLEKPNKNIPNLLQELGYRFYAQEKEESIFLKRLGFGNYPRFHIYLKNNKDLHFNLHLDQKKPIYKGAPAHSAEYDGEILKKEAERIKEKFKGL